MENSELTSINNAIDAAKTNKNTGEHKEVSVIEHGTIHSQQGTTGDLNSESVATSMVSKKVRFHIDESRFGVNPSKRLVEEVPHSTEEQSRKQSKQTTIYDPGTLISSGTNVALQGKHGPSRIRGERGDTFLEGLQSMNAKEREDTLEKIRDRFMELMEPTLKKCTIHLPYLTCFLTDKVFGALNVLLTNFRSFYYRVSVNAPSSGHHPMFNRDGMTRTGSLDPTSFAIVSTFEYIQLLNGRFKVHLKNEIKQNKNIRLRNFLAFRVNEKLSYISVDGDSSCVVRQNGLTLHEASLFYFICSRRRLLIEDIRILQRAFPYFTFEEDIYRILNEMTMFVSENVPIDDILQSFMNDYVMVLFNIMFSPLISDFAYLHMDVFHDNLLKHWNNE